MEFSITIPGLEELIATLTSIGGNASKLINLALKASLLHVQQEARVRAPHRTGTLQRSILPEFHNLFGTVKVNEKYGLWLEEGTDAFDIVPRNKQALMWPGAAHPVKRVHHPGLKARPFFQPAIEASYPFMNEQFMLVFATIERAIQTRSQVNG